MNDARECQNPECKHLKHEGPCMCTIQGQLQICPCQSFVSAQETVRRCEEQAQVSAFDLPDEQIKPTQAETGNGGELEARITNYLGNGGLFNPEIMEHDKVRDLLMDCREHISKTQALQAEVKRLAEFQFDEQYDYEQIYKRYHDANPVDCHSIFEWLDRLEILQKERDQLKVENITLRNIKNGSSASSDGSIEFLTVDIPKEVLLVCAHLNARVSELQSDKADLVRVLRDLSIAAQRLHDKSFCSDLHCCFRTSIVAADKALQSLGK